MSLMIDINKDKINGKVICFAIVSLTALEMVALATGHNGTMLKIVIAIIAMSAGIVIPTPGFLTKKNG